MIRLLIVEDDQSLCYIEKTSLEEIIGGYQVTTAANGEEGLREWNSHDFDVIVADIDMPVMDGFEMVERIRETDKEIIVVFTSALTSPNDVKAGFRLGINNYIKKPFMPEELDAHIQALLKLKNGQRNYVEKNQYHIGKFVLDVSHATLRDIQTDEVKIITLREVQILQILAENMNDVVRREAIVNRCWNQRYDYFVSRSLDVFVNKLRKLLADDPTVNIVTVRGVGLQLSVSDQLPMQ